MPSPDSPGALFPWRGVAPSVVLVGREIGRAAERRRRWSMEEHGELEASSAKNNNSSEKAPDFFSNKTPLITFRIKTL
jgi:hypothetical protein